MSSEHAISVRGLRKTYYTYRNPFARLSDVVAGRMRRFNSTHEALAGLDFDIDRGECVGIIGRNGSGKSTLLEILTGTLEPTAGQVRVEGEVAALLELGAGFNPQFTGRENVILNRSIIGAGRDNEESLEQIREFAGIGDYFDRPVRTYSSGMYVRLAFAAAISVNPDILIVDEALSVGDVRFQRKCFRRFEELKNAGKTILFVTHSPELVKTHCTCAIFLNEGRIEEMGDPGPVIHHYLTRMFSTDNRVATISGKRSSGEAPAHKLNMDPGIDGCPVNPVYNPTEYRWGSGVAKILDFAVICDGRLNPALIRSHQQVTVKMPVHFSESVSGLIFGITIKSVEGVTVFGTNSRIRPGLPSDASAGETKIIVFKFVCRLLTGNYFLSLGVARDHDEVDNEALDRRYDIATLVVEGGYQDFGFVDAEVAMETETDPELTLTVMGNPG